MTGPLGGPHFEDMLAMSASVNPRAMRPSIASEEELSFGEIAKHWAGQPGHKSEGELLAILVGAMFLGQFRPYASERTRSAACDPDFVLKALIDARGIPDSVYVDEDSSQELLGRGQGSAPEPVTERPLIYDHRQLQIDLHALAEAPIDSYPEIGQKVLRNIRIHRDIFRSWCEDRGIDFPNFWRRRGETYLRKTALRPAVECEKWLKEQVAAGNRIGKRKLFEQAQKEIRGLHYSHFCSAWDTVAPAEWKKSGAIPKRSKT